MRWRGLAVVAGALALATGCDAPTRPEHHEQVHSLAVTATVADDGTVAMSARVELPAGDGLDLTLSAPTLGTVDGLTVGGDPVRDGGDEVDVHVGGGTTELTWTVHGAVERYGDAALVTLPVWTRFRGADADALRFPATVTLVAPAPPVGAPHVHGAIGGSVRADGSDVVATGTFAPTTDASMGLLLPPDAVPAAPLLTGTGRAASFTAKQADLDAVDARVAANVAADADDEDRTATLYWVLVGLEAAVPFLISFGALAQAAWVRGRARAGATGELQDPPGELHPALVALLQAEGHDIGAEAVAATILGLVERKALAIDGVTSERYLLRVEGGGATPAESALLDALRAAAAAPTAGGDPVVVGPPMPIVTDGWWRLLRREVATQARRQGLLRRRYPSALFGTAIVALAVTTAPLYARTPELLVAGVVVAALLAALPSVGGYVLTARGHRERARWEAYRRHLAHQGDLGDVGAPGIAVWGPHLVYGAALGVARTAVRDLSPEPIKPEEKVLS